MNYELLNLFLCGFVLSFSNEKHKVLNITLKGTVEKPVGVLVELRDNWSNCQRSDE